MKRLIVLAAGLVGTTMLLAASGESPQERNKRVVVDFYEKAINQKDFDAAKMYIGSRYTQHNPMAADGPEGLHHFLDGMKASGSPFHAEIKQVFADGDYVILHVLAKANPSDRGSAVMDIFKLEDGKVVEHWDVIQPIPEKAMNSNTMF